MFDWTAMLENSLYFLVLLNPISKVMFLSTYDPPLTKPEITELSWKSSLAALAMLVFLAAVGKFMLGVVFRVEIYSLRIVGGLVVFVIGWNAIREGRFAHKREAGGLRENFTDLSLVPLAAPLIAGPGTIAAAITYTASVGLVSVCLSLTLAIFVNFLVMLFSPGITRVLEKIHFMGPLIRVTGLIIAAVATQMILTGIDEFITQLLP